MALPQERIVGDLGRIIACGKISKIEKQERRQLVKPLGRPDRGLRIAPNNRLWFQRSFITPKIKTGSSASGMSSGCRQKSEIGLSRKVCVQMERDDRVVGFQ